MLNTNYNLLQFSAVGNLPSFFREKLSEITKIKSIYENTKMLFNLPPDRLKLFVAEGERVYKIIFFTPDIHKYPIGWFVYLPLQSRLDLYEANSPDIPFIQWKNKKPVFKNYSELLSFAGADKLFNRVVIVS